jgi:mannose-6-phosphate isomerase-like protein (cupin superfamily)
VSLTPIALPYIRNQLFEYIIRFSFSPFRADIAMDNSLLFNRSEIAKDWHARGFSCGVWIDHAGREWSYQAQKNDELFMLLSGELELAIEARSIRPSVGEEIRIPSGIPHTIRNAKGKTARWLYGQRQETVSVPQPPNTAQERSFHPELKRKRRPEKRVPSVEVSKDV